ncbi:MAG: hypothetical protein IAF94_20865 [Pirellulaceae bacterium]|nr:hypothetical protein [Pirellulaceae bacterium]
MSPLDDETKRLMDSIFIEKVLRARRTPIDVKIMDGPRLFDMNCALARGGIRSQFPNYSDEQVERELRRRLAIARRIDEANIYRNVEDPDE